MKIMYQPAVPEDAPALHVHLESVLRETTHAPTRPEELPSLRELREHLADAGGSSERHLCLLALDGGRIVGHGDIYRGSLAANQHTAMLGIAVQQEYWGRGIGTALLEHLLQWARHHQVQKVKLNVFAHNERALALYRRFGFVEEGRERDEFRLDGQSVDNIIMALFLDQSKK